MTDGPDSSPAAACPERLGCVWSAHGRKHFPHHGLRKEHTVHGPAKYLAGMSQADIKATETATVRAPTTRLSLPPGKSEYARDIGSVVGWDAGGDATFSFVECSGGASSGRTYHGRPMSSGNQKLRRTQDGER